MWKTYWQPRSLDEALVLLDRHAGQARIVAGGTDVLGELRRRVNRTQTLIEIRVLLVTAHKRSLSLKRGWPRAQAISVIALAIVATFARRSPSPFQRRTGDGAFEGEPISTAVITLGCLAPTIVHAASAEAFLHGQRLDAAACAEAGRLACRDGTPLDDRRGSARHRPAPPPPLGSHG